MDITVCMSFRNEGEEVARTCKSIRDTAPDIPIICVNDASDDGFDYISSLKPYKVTYIQNESPLGCSLGREKAIQACQTKWFIALDAHCRMYTQDWIQQLEDSNLSENGIYCCTCVAFDPENDSYDKTKAKGCGATLGKGKNLLKPRWCYNKENKTTPYEVKIVLGANYISTKEWWNHIRGFNGIKRYGQDETLISLKSWMAGGTVQCIPNVMTGHLFRKKAPYPMPKVHILYNEMAIISICAPYLFEKYEQLLRKYYPEQTVNTVMKEIQENKSLLIDEHLKLMSITKVSFEEAYQMPNNKVKNIPEP